MPKKKKVKKVSAAEKRADRIASEAAEAKKVALERQHLSDVHDAIDGLPGNKLARVRPDLKDGSPFSFLYPLMVPVNPAARLASWFATHPIAIPLEVKKDA